MLYYQPDFTEGELALEITCKARGFEAMFLPKFHCKMNFIEQCWGYSKRVYCQYPPSSKEADLEMNMLATLESVPLVTIWRYGTFLNLINDMILLISYTFMTTGMLDALISSSMLMPTD
jgi:hypothetical protein